MKKYLSSFTHMKKGRRQCKLGISPSVSEHQPKHNLDKFWIIIKINKFLLIFHAHLFKHIILQCLIYKN